MKVGIVGLGYVGIPLASLCAKKNDVLGFDIDIKKVESINSGTCPIVDEFVMKDFNESPFKATCDFSLLEEMDIIVVCVPTPVDSSKKPQLKYLESATKSIAKRLKRGQLIIIESTIYPGTTEELVVPILEGENNIEPIKVFENLYLIPSDVDIKKHNSEKIVGGSKLRKIRQNETIKTFDIVFIDTPPTMSSLVQEALSTSDYYFIPSKPEFLAVEGVGQAMSFAKQTISEVPHTDPHFLGVVLNQVDTRRASYHDFVSELKQILSDKLFTTHISQLTEIADSPFYAKTVLDFSEYSKARIEFEELSSELLEKVGL